MIMSNGKPLTVYRIIDEPTAAAIAYGNSKQEDMDKTVLIYDLGGGTFDCTVMQLKFNGPPREMQVDTTNGNHQLGTSDLTTEFARLVNHIFSMEHGSSPSAMAQAPLKHRVFR